MANSSVFDTHTDTHTYVSWTPRTDHITCGEMKQGKKEGKKCPRLDFNPRPTDYSAQVGVVSSGWFWSE